MFYFDKWYNYLNLALYSWKFSLQISYVLYCFGSQYVDPDECSRLVNLITDPFRYIGLSSYSSVYKLHWAAKVSIFCFLVSCVLQVVTLFTANNDPDKLFECFSILSFCGMGVLKLHSLCKYHKGWHFLLNQISSLENQQLQAKPSPLEYQSNNDENINFSDYINVYTNKFKTASTILIKIYFFTATLFILSPFIEQILCKLIESMECVTYPHILPCWSPLDDITFIGYLITVVSECLAAAYCVSVHLAFDLMSFGVMIFVCGQFSLLREYSSLIGGKGKKCNLSKKRDERAHFRIKQCHHTNFILVKYVLISFSISCFRLRWRTFNYFCIMFFLDPLQNWTNCW